MDHSIRFWDNHAEKYAKQKIADPSTYEKKLALTQRYLTKDASVLEYGCGTGSTALLHAPHVKDMLAIDYSQKMIEIAQHKLQDSDVSNLEFRQGTLFDLPAEESFDAIMGLNVLHLMRDMDAAIERSYALLKPGGVFVTSTACLAEKMSFFRFILPIGVWLRMFPFVRSITIQRVEESMKRAGFQIIEKMVQEKVSCFLIARKNG